MVVAGQQGIWYFHKSTPTPYPIDNVNSFQKTLLRTLKEHRRRSFQERKPKQGIGYSIKTK